MEKEIVCPLCDKRISNWMRATNKTVMVDDKEVHKACLMDLGASHATKSQS